MLLELLSAHPRRCCGAPAEVAQVSPRRQAVAALAAALAWRDRRQKRGRCMPAGGVGQVDTLALHWPPALQQQALRAWQQQALVSPHTCCHRHSPCFLVLLHLQQLPWAPSTPSILSLFQAQVQGQGQGQQLVVLLLLLLVWTLPQ